MHPVIARFLSSKATQSALQASDDGGDPQVRALREASTRKPHLKKAALQGGGKNAEEASIALATEAATALLADDAKVAPHLAKAKAALATAGASPEEAGQLLAEVLLDEAFAWDSEPEAFDVALVNETFDTLPALGALDNETVDDLMEAFAKGGASGTQALRIKVVEALFEAAWGNGPAAINAEHVDTALEALSDSVSEKELSLLLQTMGDALTLLHKAGLVGSLRLARLLDVVKSSAGGFGGSGGDDEEDDDEGEEEEDEPDTEQGPSA
jgi:hypothetical protein